MDLSEQSIHDVIHPTAAFSTVPETGTEHGINGGPGQAQEPRSWDESWLNPKNRIDSLDVPQDVSWRIDGCTAFGSQFYAIPLFMGSMPPLRMDLFTPELSKLPPAMRSLLDVDVTFHTRDRDRIAQLGLTRHVLRILHYWVSKLEDPRRLYDNLPFGSRIVLNNMPVNIREASITIARTHYLERQLLSVASLQKLWGPELKLPRSVDITDVVYVSQIHDSTCLVEIDDRVWIFKALTSYPKYLYHELWRLLKVPPHSGVVSRPVHLVTKKCAFGGKLAVIGFTLENHIHGSLRDLIPVLKLHNKISLRHQTRWSVQLASALIHLREHTGTFYPDLRLDNIVLSAKEDLVMVDFEQRGVWCEFAAPEVNAIEYVRLLAIDEEIPDADRNRYAAVLSRLLPGWEELQNREDYTKAVTSYNIPWECLTPREHEACEVYMLGRVLWCIFEAKSAPQRAAVWLSYRWEPLVEFPEYVHTPVPLRGLIDRCTRGRRDGLSKLIVREGNKLVLRRLEGTGLSTARQVQETSRDWWTQEILNSEKWLEERAKGMETGRWNENYYDRPTLRQVHSELEAFYDELTPSN